MRDDNPGAKRDPRHRVHLAVLVSMLLIIGGWVVLLPGQLRIAMFSGGDASRWTDVTEEASVTFDEALANLRSELEALEEQREEEAAADDGEVDAPSRASLPILEERGDAQRQVELLRARLEASRSNE